MKKQTIFILIVLGIILSVILILAADFTPQGNINMQNRFNITNIPMINGINFTLFYDSVDSVSMNARIDNINSSLITTNNTLNSVNSTLQGNIDTANLRITSVNGTITNNNISWSSTFNLTYDAKISANSSFNQSLTDTLYSGIVWAYNQTTATYNLYNVVWSSTFNTTYSNKADYNTTINYNTTGNVTGSYHCLVQNCSHRIYYNGSATIIE